MVPYVGHTVAFVWPFEHQAACPGSKAAAVEASEHMVAAVQATDHRAAAV